MGGGVGTLREVGHNVLREVGGRWGWGESPEAYTLSPARTWFLPALREGNDPHGQLCFTHLSRACRLSSSCLVPGPP